MHERTRVVIELEPGAEPISGTLELAGAVREDFVGWLELVVLMEGARTRTSALDFHGAKPRLG